MGTFRNSKNYRFWTLKNLDISGRKVDKFKLELPQTKKTEYFARKLLIEKLEFLE